MNTFSPAMIPTNANSTYSVSGADCQVLTVALKYKEQITTESGAFMFSSPGVRSTAECGNCSRTCVGEACCKTVFHNNDHSDGFVAVTPNFPAKVVPIDLSTMPGSNIIAKRGAYFCHIGDVALKATYDCCPTTACCGGLGFARQHLSGKGTVFLTAGGVVLTKVLELGETIVCDTDAIVAYQDTVSVTVAMQDSLCVCLYGGEGCFNTTLTGPGLIVVESMSFIRYKNAVAPPPQAPQGPDGQPAPNGGNAA